MGRGKSDSICSLVISPPPSALSPTPSSTDTISTGNQAGRIGSAMELEWDDIFAEEDASLPGVTSSALANGGAASLPPRHIQEMRRTATKLVHGSYVEESEFQDDVLVYDLIAQKDSKAAILDRIMAANGRSRGSQITNDHTSTTSLTGRTVIETVNSIMSTRRRSEDGGKEERRRSEDVEDEKSRRRPFFNGLDMKSYVIDECEDADEDHKPNCDCEADSGHNSPTHQQHVNEDSINVLASRPPELETSDPATGSPKLPQNKVSGTNDFLSQYRELMLSVGVDPDCDFPDDVSTFRRRVRALRQKLESEQVELGEELVVTSVWVNGDEEMVTEEEEELGEERSGCEKGLPFTGGYHQHRLHLLTATLSCSCPLCHRSLHQRPLVAAREPSGELDCRKPARHRHPGPAGVVPAASAEVLPAQHRHNTAPAQRAHAASGTLGATHM